MSQQWENIQGTNKVKKTIEQDGYILDFILPETVEADWIKAIRNYCRENSIAPTTLITAYEELKKKATT